MLGLMENPLDKLLTANKDSPLSESAKEVMAAPAPEKFYAIYITARSGSTYLNQELRLRSKLGDPNEWFNPDSIGPRLEEFGLSNISDYTNFIIRFKSPNGIFGYQISWPHHLFLNNLISLEAFIGKPFVYFFLRRRNIVAQAVSLVFADTTGYFHTYQNDLSVPDYGKLTYDPQKIKGFCNDLAAQEKKILTYFNEMRISPIELYYEDICEDIDVAVSVVRNALGVRDDPLQPIKPNPIRKLGTSVNDEWEVRFRDEEAKFLSKLMKWRPPLAQYQPYV